MIFSFLTLPGWAEYIATLQYNALLLHFRVLIWVICIGGYNSERGDLDDWSAGWGMWGGKKRIKYYGMYSTSVSVAHTALTLALSQRERERAFPGRAWERGNRWKR
jgi:hypothetical protein